jgi:hypothetical protein
LKVIAFLDLKEDFEIFLPMHEVFWEDKLILLVMSPEVISKCKDRNFDFTTIEYYKKIFKSVEITSKLIGKILEKEGPDLIYVFKQKKILNRKNNIFEEIINNGTWDSKIKIMYHK